MRQTFTHRALALAVASLFGQAEAETLIRTSPVEVIASTPLPGAGLPREQVASNVQVLDGAVFEARSGSNLIEILNRQLGSVFVNEVQNNPFQPDLNYRGFTASPLLGTPQGLSVYMDGVRLNQPFGDVVSWDLLPRSAIASLALMPGSNPVFGLNTLGGAVSIQTKDGYSHPGSAVQATVGSYGRRNVEFEHGGHHESGLHWFATGNLYKEDGWRDSSPSDVGQFFGKLGWLDARTDVSLSLALANNRLTGNGLQEQRLQAADYASVYTKPDETKNRSLFLNLSGKHSVSDDLLFSGNAYYRRMRSSTYNGDLNDDALDQSVYQPSAAERVALAAAGYAGFPLSGATAANTPFPYWRCIANVLLKDEPAEKCNGLINRTETQQENAGLSGQFTLNSQLAGQKNQLTGGLGFDASRIRFRQTAQFGYLNPDRSITPVNFFADGTELDDKGKPIDSRVDLIGRTQTWSVYATDTLSLAERWHLTLSGRYNRTTVINRDQIVSGGGAGSLDGDHHYSRFNPAIGMTYTPARALNVYAGYNEGSRTPTAVELGCADPANPCKLPNAMAGDPPLKQVVTRTWEAGLRGSLGQETHWHAGLFRADNHDDILFVANNAAGYGYFRNFGQTRRQGIELGLDSRIDRLSLAIDYTYLDATYRSSETVNGAANSSNDASSPGLEGNVDIRPGDRMPLIPRHLFKARADWQINGAWSVGLGMQAVSSSLARGNENNRHQADGVYYLGSGKAAGYAVFDLGARLRATPALSFFAQINNLFDREYASAAQLGATGFNASGGFVARPFAAVGGEYPLLNSTFVAPGAPRTGWLGVRYVFGR